MSARPKLRSENFTDANTAAKVLNTVVLTPLYGRLEALEKKGLFQVSLTTAAVLADTYPFPLPTPAFPVQSAKVVMAWDETNNAAPQGIDTPIVRYNGGQLQLMWLNLSVSTKYILTFELS